MKQVCGAKLRGKDRHCQKSPMANGRCRLHGGATPNGPENRNFKHGRYASVFQGTLAEKFDKAVKDKKPLDLQAELAVLRVLNEQYIETMNTRKKVRAADVNNVAGLTAAVINAAARIAKMRNDQAFTMAEVRYVQARMIQLMEKYVPDPERRRNFIEEVRGLIPGRNAADEDTPAELPAGAVQAV